MQTTADNSDLKIAVESKSREEFDAKLNWSKKKKERTVTNMDGEANLKKCTKKNGRKNETWEG